MTHTFGPNIAGHTPPPESRPIYVCTGCKSEMYADAAGQPYYRSILGEWKAGQWNDLCLGMDLSRQIELMLDLRELVLAGFANAHSDIGWRIWHSPLDDRREYFWRLADDDKSLIYGESRGDVADIGENTFVDTVHCIWRPAGAKFVVLLCNDDLGKQDVVVFLANEMEQTLPKGNS